jgi:hypothetical protein
MFYTYYAYKNRLMFISLTGLTNFDCLVGTPPDSAYLEVQHRKFMRLSFNLTCSRLVSGEVLPSVCSVQ